MSASVLQSVAPIRAEANRLAVLRDFEILDTGPETTFDSLTEVAAHICNAPMALISLIDEKRRWIKSSVGLDGVQETPLELAICAHAILQADLFVVPDATKDAGFSGNPLVTPSSRRPRLPAPTVRLKA